MNDLIAILLMGVVAALVILFDSPIADGLSIGVGGGLIYAFGIREGQRTLARKLSE